MRLGSGFGAQEKFSEPKLQIWDYHFIGGCEDKSLVGEDERANSGTSGTPALRG